MVIFETIFFYLAPAFSFKKHVNKSEEFYNKYSNATNSFLSTYMYQWDAMPLLSLLGKKYIEPSMQVTPEQQ